MNPDKVNNFFKKI